MGSSILRTVVGWALMVVVPASMVLAEPGTNAMLYSSGAVVVNGRGSNGTGAVFAGDNIRTCENCAARISMPGSTIVVPSNSDLLYAGRSVELSAGQVEINTSNGMEARVAGLRVAPSNGTARFQIAKLEGAVKIAAERGSLLVSDGETTSVVQEGSTQTKDEPQPSSPEKKNKKKKGGVVPVPGSSQGVGRVAELAAGTVVVGGIVTSIVTTGPPCSKTKR